MPGGSAAAALLDDVRELVGEQAAPLLAMGRVFAGSEDDVVTQGEGASAQTAGGAGGRRVTVDADAAEVFADSWFFEPNNVCSVPPRVRFRSAGAYFPLSLDQEDQVLGGNAGVIE